MQFLHFSSTKVSINGNHTFSLRRAFVFTIPKCPACAKSTQCLYRVCGITNLVPRKIISSPSTSSTVPDLILRMHCTFYPAHSFSLQLFVFTDEITFSNVLSSFVAVAISDKFKAFGTECDAIKFT